MLLHASPYQIRLRIKLGPSSKPSTIVSNKLNTFPSPLTIQTARLQLRPWLPSDLVPFAALNADPEVTRYFPTTLSREQSDTIAQRCQALIAERGWGLWAAENLESGEFIGMIGLHIPAVALPFAPCVEIGWRLARQHWGKGYATEGARGALELAFSKIGLSEVVSFTSIHNTRSELVMQRLGMQRQPDTFAHPSVEAGSWLSEHCLYKIQK